MDQLLGGQKVETTAGVSRLLKMDVNSPEYQQAKQERIENRRARIAAKIAKEKGNDSQATKTPSSLEFLSLHNASAKDGQKKKGSARTGSAGSAKLSDFAESQQPPEFADPQMDTQLEDSRKQLEQIIIDGEALITNVKVAAEYREKMRHVRVDESRKERLQRLHDEAKESQDIYEKITQSWMNSAEKMLPLELYTKIQEQQKACDDLLEKQDEEIYNLRKELEDQDIEYEDNLEIYQKDIMLMGDRIDDTVDTLRAAFMEELELIEQYTVQDREQLLEENQKEFLDLLKEYEKLEKQALEERKSDALNKFDRLTDLYGSVKQEARILKNQMQHDMRTLFMEREQIKCAIQLNLEKLDYNLSVLRKREEENMRMKNSMKRLLLKLQDRFNEKATNLREKVAKGKRDSNRLIADIRRLEVLCDDAKSKTLHFYASDYHKFMDLWEMNEEECTEKLCRLLGSERYIIEEQLGTKFVQPDLSRLEQRPKEVQCYQDKVACCRPNLSMTSQAAPAASASVVHFAGPQDTKSKLAGLRTADSAAVTSVASIFAFDSNLDTKIPQNQKSNPSLFVDPGSEYEFCNLGEPDPDLLRNLMKHITKVICDQTGFLLEDKLRKLLAPMVDSEKRLIHIDTVLQALHVTHIDQMQFLARYILKYSRVMKGIISRNDMSVPEPGTMALSEDSKSQKEPQSSSECETGVVEGERKETLERLREVHRLSSTDSEDEPKPPSVPPSAIEVLSETALQDIRGIKEVHGVAPTEAQSQVEVKSGTDNKDNLTSDGSMVEIIQQFSSDESLAGVLRQVEMYGPNAEDPNAASSSTCSCETIVDASDSTTDKLSGSQRPDPFGSNKATVLSWVTEVAAGLTSDCKPQAGEFVGEDDGLEEFDEEGNVVKRIVAIRASEQYRAATATTAKQEFESRSGMTPARSSCGPSERSQIDTALSPESAPDSTEFFYVEPNDVLRALAAFCRDHHAKIKVKIPTKAEICDAKIAKMCLPSKEAVKEYWDRFIRLADPKSKFLWDGVQAVFTEYDQNLKLRNQYVEDIIKLYRQNYELSHLLKKHIKQANQTCFAKNQAGPFYPSQLPYCGECPKPTKSPPDTFQFPSCPKRTRKQRRDVNQVDFSVDE